MVFRFGRPSASNRRELADRKGSDEEHNQRYPILRISYREGVERRKEEEVKTNYSKDRSKKRGLATPSNCDEENDKQESQRDSR